jgi:type IV secretory pathway TraG/TraD family ATPase VirD4
MSRTQESQSSSLIGQVIDPLIGTLFQPEIVFLLFFSVLLLGFGKIFGRQKGILADAYWGGRLEKMAALKRAQKQRKKRKIDQVALFAGNEPTIGWKPHLKTLLTGNPPCLPLPDLNQHGLILGSTGCGKTTTINNRIIQDAIRREHALIVFDPKGDLAQIHAPYAEAFNYEIYCLAPGKPYTERFNLLDFLHDFKDSSRAEQLAKTTIRNANGGGFSKSDPFFGPSGEKLVRSILMLAKSSPYPDLVMTKRLLSLGDLTERLRAANEAGKLHPIIEDSFQQFLSGENSEKTIAGIQSTASLIFDGFTRDEFFNAFIGESTIPRRFTGRKILFVQPLMSQIDVIMPLLAAFIDLFVEENFEQLTNESLLLFLEEFPVGYFPRIEQWMALRRASGLSVFLTAQNIAQIRRRYGADDMATIFSNAMTQFYFNPNDNETAELVSKRCGEKEVRYKQFSRSHGKGGGSHSFSEQIHKVPLMPSYRVTQMEQGEFVLFNPAYASGGRASVPIHLKYVIPDKILDQDEELKNAWQQLTYPELCERAAQFHLKEEQRLEALKLRVKAANDLLPLREQQSRAKGAENEKSSYYGVLADEKEAFEDFV